MFVAFGRVFKEPEPETACNFGALSVSYLARKWAGYFGPGVRYVHSVFLLCRPPLAGISKVPETDTLSIFITVRNYHLYHVFVIAKTLQGRMVWTVSRQGL
jgi:hypothetical protein